MSPMSAADSAGPGPADVRRRDHAARGQDVLAHRKPDARLLLVARERQVGVEHVLRTFGIARRMRAETPTIISG